MEIRKLEQQDINILESAWGVRKPFEDRLHSMKEGKSVFFICWDKNEPVGHGKIILSEPPLIEDMYVDENMRSQGVGREILSFLESVAGLPLQLRVDPSNKRALKFYLNNGYKIIGTGDFMLLSKTKSS